MNWHMCVHTCIFLRAWIVQFLRKINSLSYCRNKALFQGKVGHDSTQDALQLSWASGAWNEVPNREDKSRLARHCSSYECSTFHLSESVADAPQHHGSRQHSSSSLYLSLVL